MFLRLPEPELRELISAFLRCLKENINKGVVMFTGLRFHDLKMLKCLDKAVWDSMGNHQRENTLRDSLQKFITLHKARSPISLRLVQNACKNGAIGPGVTPRGPKYAQEP